MTIEKNEENLKLYEKFKQYIGEEMEESIRVEVETIVSTCYVVIKFQHNSFQQLEEGICALNEELQSFVKKNLNVSFESVKKIAGEFTKSELQKIATIDEVRISEGTPGSIESLVERLLKIKENDHVMHFGCGEGEFLLDIIQPNKGAHFNGSELGSKLRMIAELRMLIMEYNVNILKNHTTDMKYDKIFLNQLTGMGQARELKNNKALLVDWEYNKLVIDHLAKGGKAICVMTNGGTRNQKDSDIRQKFVSNGYIESVIELPEKMFVSTSISMIVIVLSYGNKTIKMINAQEICQTGRRQNYFSNEDIEKILVGIDKNTSYSHAVTIAEIADNDYIINPSRYLMENSVIKDGVEFGTVIKSLTRGAQFKAAELDEITTTHTTNMQYLMLANITDGCIDEELPYLTHVEQKYKKYCIKNNDLVISKNGNPIKVAVAQVDEGKTILGNGNLYIIELDPNSINPYFVKAFLESEAGKAVLNRIVVGTVIQNITVEGLKKMIIPKPDLETQNKIATEYIEKVKRLKALKEEIEVIKLELKSVYKIES